MMIQCFSKKKKNIYIVIQQPRSMSYVYTYVSSEGKYSWILVKMNTEKLHFLKRSIIGQNKYV